MKKKYLLLILIIMLLTSCKDKMYTVKFIDNNQLLSSINIKKGDTIKNIDNPKKDGYIFQNWLKDGLDYDISTPITEDITLIANWIEEPDLPNTHKVTFDFGEYKKTQTVFDNELATEPKEIPKKEKHTFIGWYYNDELYDFNTKVTQNITLKAKFKLTRITINYDLVGASGTIKTEIDKGSIPIKPKNPEKFGYTFKYWSINNNEYNFDTPLYEDTVIKANFEANKYVRVSFNTDGGNTIKSAILLEGEKLTELPIPKKENYTFKYWSYNDIEFDINTKIDKDITLIAIYEKIDNINDI